MTSTDSERVEELRRKVERLLDLAGHAPVGPEGNRQSKSDAAEIIASLSSIPAQQEEVTEALSNWADELDAGTSPRAVAAAMRRSAAMRSAAREATNAD